MPSRTRVVGFLTGLILGTAIMLALTSGDGAPRAAAQAQAPQPPSGVPRYQLSAWAHPAGSIGQGGGSYSAYGAYILDTQGGKVWLVQGNHAPEALGSVGSVP